MKNKRRKRKSPMYWVSVAMLVAVAALVAAAIVVPAISASFGKSPHFLQPVSTTATTALLKWGQKVARERLLAKMGVDYLKTPAEDWASGIITFRNPETGQLVNGQFTSSWMFDLLALELAMRALGPGYAFSYNSLVGPGQIFVGDEAAEGAADAERAVEKSTTSRGLMLVHGNEPDTYGHPDELIDAVKAFQAGHDAFLNWQYGADTLRFCQAAYWSAENGNRAFEFANPPVELQDWTSAISRGEGHKVLGIAA